MKFVEEVVVDEFLPTFRSMLADALRERGYTQSEVAKALGVSQSAVSKYVHDEVARRDAVAEHPRVKALVEETADGLAADEMTRAQALVEAEVLIRRLEEDDLIARLHEEEMPEFADYEGRIRDPEGTIRTAEQVLASTRRGLRVLENAGGFTGLIPAVGSNLCECLPEAKTIEEVAGVPGRIVDVKGRATIPADPEFGASGHVARVLLTARETGAGADVRGCLNVAYDPELVGRLEETGLPAAEFEADEEIETAVATALGDQPDARALYQTGAFGIEPVVYVLGEDAETVARTIRKVL